MVHCVYIAPLSALIVVVLDLRYLAQFLNLCGSKASSVKN